MAFFLKVPRFQEQTVLFGSVSKIRVNFSIFRRKTEKTILS